MKKIITLILSAFTVIAQCPSTVMAANENIQDKNIQEEIIEVRIDNDDYKELYLEADGKASIVRINKNTGDIVVEVEENGQFKHKISSNLYTYSNDENSLSAGEIAGEVIEESISGWGIFLPNVDSIPYSLKCPKEFQDEQGVDKVISIEQGIKDIYVMGFTDELTYFLEDRELMNEYNVKATVDGCIALLCILGATYFGNPKFVAEAVIKSCELTVLTVKVQNLIEDMAEEQDNMGVYYIKLSRLAN